MIYSETSDTWINVHDSLYFLEITNIACTFLWASEESGFRHLYLITSSLTDINNIGINGSNPTSYSSTLRNHDNIEYIDGISLVPHIINKVIYNNSNN